MNNKILKSKINLKSDIKGLIENSKNEIIVFSPYIKLSALKTLLFELRQNIDITIVTTWKKHDVAFKSSDLSVYPYCKENNYKLRINNQIHLKCITIDGMKSTYLGSANITNSGLGLGNKYNLEIGSIHNDMCAEDKLYLYKIMNESIPVDDNYYNKILKESEKLDKPEKDEQFETKIDFNKDFLLSSLPMCKSPQIFYDFYFDKEIDEVSDDYLCFLSDCDLYEIPRDLNEKELKEKLTFNFHNHPFIKSLFEKVGDKEWFGTISKWLHNKVETVPTPKRKKIKEIQQNLYAFIDELSENYVIETPEGGHSQVIRKV